MSVVALIPAYRPDEQLIDIVAALRREATFSKIVVVDDGSGDAYRAIFERLLSFGDCITVLRHAVNLGKGAALKTGMNFALVDDPGLIGVVTADADGQHKPRDIRQVGERLRERPATLILGARGFQGKVPLRSRVGNELTKLVFRAIIGRRLSDTQTGLRGIPARLIDKLLPLRSSRYEFEMDMLITAAQSGYDFHEEAIETVYISDNRASHFNPFFDSFRIYFTLLRYGFSSSLTYMVDIAVFYLAYSTTGTILWAHILARLGAVTLNFLLVRDFVFQARRRGLGLFSAYLGVVVASGAISYAAQIALIEGSGMHPLLAKCAVESLLFFANFLILRDLIFSDRTK
jgi:glycosyltransferase involved in cell wall biosynthesis